MAIIFRPYDISRDRDFLYAAHRETSEITVGAPFDDEKICRELSKDYAVRDGLFLDGKMVGICDLSRRNSPELGTYGYVNFFYVAPAYRGAGFGGHLACHAADWCRGNGLCRLLLHTGRGNTAAQCCYVKNGFVRFPAFDKVPEWGYALEIGGEER